MTFGLFIILLAVLAMLMCAFFFIVCRKYEEGIVGNLFLGLMFIAALVILWDIHVRPISVTLERLPEPAWLLLIVCAAMFMLRHAYRFAMFHWHGHFGWRPPKDCGLARQR